MIYFFRTIIRYLGSYKLAFLMVLIGFLAEVVFEAVLPLSYKFIIDEAILPRNWDLLMFIFAGLAAGGIVIYTYTIYSDFLYARLCASLLNDIRQSVFNHLQTLSIRFFKTTRTADVVARFTTDMASVENAVTQALPSIINRTIGFALGTGILFVMEWRLALISIPILSVVVFLPKWIENRAEEANDDLKDEQAGVSDAVQENVCSQDVIKVFGLEAEAARQFTGKLKRFRKKTVRANFLNYAMMRTTNIGVMVSNVMVVSVGAYLAYTSRITVGEFVAFGTIYMNLSDDFYSLFEFIPYIMQASAGLRRIDELLNEKPEVTDRPEAATLPLLARAITFQDVNFGYTPHQYNLRNINITIPKGGYAAFVGSSGSGKSTIVSLILRFYDPDTGTVRFDGMDLRQVSQSSLHAQIGAVFQDNFIYHASVLQNIRISKPDAADEDVFEAARAAEIHDFVMSLPQGYETVVDGERLSGGQRQRIAIARAILRRPALLVLDEFTSALDPAAESAINRTIDRIARNRTIAAVTHRLSTITHVDRIFVLDGGEVVETGTHEELLALNGSYRRLWDKQSGFKFSDDVLRVEVDPRKLATFPILSNLDDVLLTELSTLFVTEHYPGDRLIMREGEQGNRFYIIVRGKVEVLTGLDADDEKIIAVLEDGDYFGEIALLTRKPRVATVRTTVPGIFISLQHDLFLKIVNQSPNLLEVLTENYLERMKAL